MTLGIAPCYALGILEALWHTKAQYAEDGSIGRMSNAYLAHQIGYTACPDKLVAALIEAGFLDEHRAHRLIVHDWHVHSDNTLDAKLYRRGDRYANGTIPRGSKVGREEKAELFDRFYRQPEANLFGSVPVEELSTPEEPQMPANVLRFMPAPGGAARRLPEPEPVPEPVPVPNTPLPPLAAGETRRQQRATIERAKSTAGGQALDAAARHVIAQCRFTGTAAVRLQAAIWMAIDGECRAMNEAPEESAMRTAQDMAASYQAYLRDGPLLRFRWGVRKFFEEGHWANADGWPWDHQLLEQRRRAGVGMR